MVKNKQQVDSTGMSYSDDDVNLLEGLEAVRERSDMYIGGKDTGALHLGKEVIDNSVDEALNGFATVIKAQYSTKENRLTVEDDGRGLPTGMNKKYNIPTIELLTSRLHSGAKFNKNAFKVSGGKNGIDALVPFNGDINRKSI